MKKKESAYNPEQIGIRRVRRAGKKIMNYNPDQQQAHELFVNLGKSQTEIAGMLDVSQSTVNKWCSEFGWKEERNAKNLSPLKIHTTIMINLARIVTELEQLDWENDKQNSVQKYVLLMDAISKGNAVAQSITKSYDSLGGIILAFEEFTKWLKNNDAVRANHPDLLTILDQYTPAFTRAMAEKYG